MFLSDFEKKTIKLKKEIYEKDEKKSRKKILKNSDYNDSDLGMWIYTGIAFFLIIFLMGYCSTL